jgi:hypothetical protein
MGSGIMGHFMKRIVCLAAILALSGCASITRGTSEVVEVQVEPADAIVTTSLGFSCAVMPCKFKVDRKSEFTVSAAKEGYQPQTVDVTTKVSGNGAAGFAGNVLIGGVVGMGVDAATGATLDHSPNPVIIKLVPLDGASVPLVQGNAIPVVPAVPTGPMKKKTGVPVS